MLLFGAGGKERSLLPLLFSGGKDSIVMLHLALKAFRLGDREIELPFPLVHIDTGHNYPEVITFRDEQVAKLGARLVVGHVEDSIKRGTVRLRKETDSRNAAQAVTLLETIESHGFDALMGGARRDARLLPARPRVGIRTSTARVASRTRAARHAECAARLGIGTSTSRICRRHRWSCCAVLRWTLRMHAPSRCPARC